MKDLITKAELFATKYHEGMTRRDYVTPYITHSAKVAAIVMRDLMSPLGKRDIAVAAAWLHDVLEDTHVTHVELAKEFPIEVAKTVWILTHRKSEFYFDYIRAIKLDYLATRIKLADIRANMEDAPDDKQVIKYRKALAILLPE